MRGALPSHRRLVAVRGYGFEEPAYDVAWAQQQRPVRTAPNAAASPGMPAAAGPIIAKNVDLPGGPCLL